MEHSVAVAYDESPRSLELRKKLLSWMERTGNSERATAAMMGISHKVLFQHLENPPKNYSFELLLKIDRFVSSHNYSPDLHDDLSCNILQFDDSWEVMQFSDENKQQGVIFGDAGTGKSFAARERKRQHQDTVLITANITKRSVGAVLSMIASSLGCGYYGQRATSICLDEIVKRLQDWPRPLIIDESHFLKWEAFEAIRTIHDAIPFGVTYLGQPRLYDEMVGRKTKRLYDQIFSRIAVMRRLSNVISIEDVELIAQSFYVTTDKKCLTFLHKKAQGEGKLRTLTNLLKLAVRMCELQDTTLNLNLLKQADRFLMG